MDNTYPYAICIGSTKMLLLLYVTKRSSPKRLATIFFSILLSLICIHYAYSLSYNPASQQVMEFLQEKLLGDCLSSSKKTTTAYSNLYRAVNCFEQKLEEDSQDEDSEATQCFFDF